MTVRLDSLLPAEPDIKLLIKMDIEGSEVAVLNDLRACLPPQTFFFIELHNGEESLRWIREWAIQNAFEFTETRRRDEAIDGYLMRVPRVETQEALTGQTELRRSETCAPTI